MAENFTAAGIAAVGVVAIGRNEGERLVGCLASIPPGLPIAYVDSGSTDGSVAAARKAGAQVFSLDMATPFSAARARDEGWRGLMAAHPDLEYIQFVDGDCTIEPGWIAIATTFLASRPQAGVVFGRRRERHPEASLYNALCDREWDVTEGEKEACGGDSLMRVAAYRASGGFDPEMTAHEEPELSARIRSCGYRIYCIAAPMTVHDAAIYRFRQWWRRNVRAGYGYAQAFARHPRIMRNPAYTLVRSALAWGLAGPLIVLVSLGFMGPKGTLLLLAYPVQILRNLWRGRSLSRFASAASILMLVSKFAETGGMLLYVSDRMERRRRNAILYKE
jgi:glycosyltransferase involved in cell wall biosynthesis